MAARLPAHELVDPFGGLAALREKVLRTPGTPDESFSDDALRILRAARFSAKLGFTVADDVREAMGRQAGRLEVVSAERITDELSKLMLTPDPARGIELLVDTGVADLVLPEVPRLRLEADEHFRHKDVYQHSLTVLRQAIGLEDGTGSPATWCCGWPPCCTTSASPGPGSGCRTAGSRSTITKRSAPRWPGSGSPRSVSPRTW